MFFFVYQTISGTLKKERSNDAYELDLKRNFTVPLFASDAGVFTRDSQSNIGCSIHEATFLKQLNTGSL